MYANIIVSIIMIYLIIGWISGTVLLLLYAFKKRYSECDTIFIYFFIWPKLIYIFIKLFYKERKRNDLHNR